MFKVVPGTCHFQVLNLIFGMFYVTRQKARKKKLVPGRMFFLFFLIYTWYFLLLGCFFLYQVNKKRARRPNPNKNPV